MAIGGALTVTIAGSSVTIPGFLVIAAVVHAAIASGSIRTIGHRFVQVSEDKNQSGGRISLYADGCANGESIALLGGETEERDGIDKTFTNVQCGNGRGWPASICAPRWYRRVRPDRTGGADIAVRAEIPRRQHDTRTG